MFAIVKETKLIVGIVPFKSNIISLPEEASGMATGMAPGRTRRHFFEKNFLN